MEVVVSTAVVEVLAPTTAAVGDGEKLRVSNANQGDLELLKPLNYHFIIH